MSRLYQLRWEEAQQAHVILYPEGMVRLNQSSAEILKRCDGVQTVGELIADLESSFNASGIANDVLEFLEVARGKGWIRVK
jgi:pyrroloquinoline quinone biosynthesis protein D